MIDLDRLASWLRCPVCGTDLSPVERLVLGCVSGHRYDVNKHGYVNLLNGSKHIGDSATMLDARQTVLDSGLYAAIASAITAMIPPSATRIIDAGAGTGYYLRAALAHNPTAIGLALDLSPTAVRRAARSTDRLDGLVTDTWRPLPLRDASCDLILNVFAPRNLTEFARTLRPGRSLLVVLPRAGHLASLRSASGMLDIPSDKADDIIATAAPLYALLAREHVTTTLPITPSIRTALIEMGPSAHHFQPGNTTDSPLAETHLDVDVLHFTTR